MSKVQDYKDRIRSFSDFPILISYIVGLSLHDRHLTELERRDIASFARSLLPDGYLAGQLSLFL